jgi:coenzyme PQQ synthesis protein D (PqqD)
MESVISDLTLVVATKDHFSCPLGDDTIILDAKAGLYFSLDNVGALIWRLIQEPKSVRELREAILDAYEVDSSVCERDLIALLGELAGKNLVQIRNATAP